MRIENALNEVRGSKPPEQRDAEVKRRKSAPAAKDIVEISRAARVLGSQTVSTEQLDSVSDVRQARVEEVRQRVATGFYDRPEVRQAIAEAVLDSGVVRGVESVLAEGVAGKMSAAAAADARNYTWLRVARETAAFYARLLQEQSSDISKEASLLRCQEC